ncbi:taste receptor type 2 member 40-like [Engystomops pustulosus]|uniref:taste receptor type 2 member 40-like n=1 Tax=Engystomops pustulosus TaxID=76066 RepID=UPI003AFA90D1
MAENTYYIPQLGLVIAVEISYTAGLMTNLFIVGVTALDCLKGRPLTPADHLITGIATSRIIFQLIILFNVSWIIFNGEHSEAFDVAIYFLGNYSVYCNICFSVLLSVFYSLKISNFHNVFFLCLRKMITQRLLGLTIIFVLLSIGYSLVVFLLHLPVTWNNSTQSDNGLDRLGFMMYVLYMLWNVLPFFFYAVSCFALLGSLFHHMCRMRRENNVTGRMDAYTKTIKFTIVSFWCFALYVTINVYGTYFLDFFALVLAWNSFLLLHSIYLIYMMARLREYLWKILQSLVPGKASRSEVQMQIISR